MPTIEANNITINYLLSSPSPQASISQQPHGELIVLINGLADDLTTWSAQVPSLLEAGYSILRYDNRGIGLSSRPPGPYTAELLADDLHALLCALDSRGEIKDEEGRGKKPLHLLGVSMGGMIAQSYALRYPNGSPTSKGWEMKTMSLCCTYAAPSPFCARMFSLWADMAVQMSVADVMRDVLLWAFTVPFFTRREREEELAGVEEGMRGLEMGREEYLSQLEVIRRFDSTSALDALKGDEKVLGNLGQGRVMVLAGATDILIPVVLSRELHERIEGSRWVTVKGGHACMWEFPDAFNKAIIAFLDEHRGQKP